MILHTQVRGVNLMAGKWMENNDCNQGYTMAVSSALAQGYSSPLAECYLPDPEILAVSKLKATPMTRDMQCCAAQGWMLMKMRMPVFHTAAAGPGHEPK